MAAMSEPLPLNSPRSKTDLFLAFTWLALQGFGGVLAVVQRVLVEEKRWMTREQFVEDWAVAQIMPGPNVVNLALMIGGRYFGLGGALAGVAGMLAAPLVVVLLLAMAFGGVSDAAWAQGALRGMGAVQTLLSEAEMGELFKVIGLTRGLGEEQTPWTGFSRGDRQMMLQASVAPLAPELTHSSDGRSS